MLCTLKLYERKNSKRSMQCGFIKTIFNKTTIMLLGNNKWIKAKAQNKNS
ncbi:MAG: hypothetical protein ACJAT1_001575 [Marivirga sp.]|jgi:hypothetical protein